MVQQAKKSELASTIISLKIYFPVLFFISASLSVLYLAPIGYMRDVYGPVINSRSVETLLRLSEILIFALLVTGLLDWIRQRILISASLNFFQILSTRVFDSTFKANLQGYPAARSALSDLRSLRIFIASPLMGYILDAPFGLFFLVLIFFIHPTMGYLALFGAALALIIGILTERRVRPLIVKAHGNANLANNFIVESSRNAEVVHAMGMANRIRQKWMLHQNLFLAQQAAASREQALGTSISKATMLIQGSALLGVGTLLTLLGHIPISAGAQLIIAKFLGAMAIRPTMQLIMGWKQIISIRESYKRLDDFLTLFPPKAAKMELPPPNGPLIVFGATVRPIGSRRAILSDISFKTNTGEILAVIGPSGAGKSSLAKALVGVTQPNLGSVRLDGIDVATWDKADLGQYIGYLPQNVELFEGSLAENICRFGFRDENSLRRAIEITGISNLISSLPRGLETNIGYDGVILSGGQRQLIGIARALYGEPKLIVMDEPNSSLDQDGEKSLVTALTEMKAKGAIVVVITHRKDILKASDQILVMNDGRQKICGPRDTVISELRKFNQNKP